MHLKIFEKLKKTLKTLSSGKKPPKNPKNPQKNPKKPTGLVFFKKTRVFSNPEFISIPFLYCPMCLCHPDPLVRGTDPDPDPSFISQK
jgi:hypothetical protein